MPVLNTKAELKKVILSMSTPEDEAFAMVKCPATIENMEGVDLASGEVKILVNIVTNVIESWNLTGEDNNVLPVVYDTVKYLPVADLIAIQKAAEIQKSFNIEKKSL